VVRIRVESSWQEHLPGGRLARARWALGWACPARELPLECASQARVPFFLFPNLVQQLVAVAQMISLSFSSSFFFVDPILVVKLSCPATLRGGKRV